MLEESRNSGTFDCIIVLFFSRYLSYFRNNKNGMEPTKGRIEEKKKRHVTFINFLIFTSLIFSVSLIYLSIIPSLI